MEKGHTMITAHAGAEGTKANALESIAVLADSGADAIEADMRFCNGRLVLSHDPVETGQRPALLEECLRMILSRPSLRLNLDLKQTGLVPAVADLAEAVGASERLILTGDLDGADMAAARAGGIEVWYNDSLAPEGTDPMRAALDAGFDRLNLCFQDVSEGMLKSPQRLSLWTVDDPEELAVWIGRGAGGVTTCAPSLAFTLRAMIEKFHLKWDAFPGSARLVSRKGRVLAANAPARRAGFAEGVRCASVKTANRHRECLLKAAFETGRGQANVLDGMMRCWIPEDDWDGAVLHLSFQSP